MTDPDLEALIDRAGRLDVFALIRAAGWSFASAPPKHVWQDACFAIINSKKSSDAEI